MPVGKKPLQIKEGVTVEKTDHQVRVKGPLGELAVTIPAGIEVRIEGDQISVSRGTEWAHLRNAIQGVTEGFSRELELVGVGYRAEKTAAGLKFSLGFSHPVEFSLPEGVEAEVTDQTKIRLKGINKQVVSQAAARIRSLRPPEPYKGKGIKFAEEVVRRKLGKAAKAIGIGPAGGGVS